ncbi:hypothetical protein MHTCC0001_11870 [Flavobacteriaceae bacterium MHTCC 0001]
MIPNAFAISRMLLGTMILVLGINKFHNFIDIFETTTQAKAFINAVSSSGTYTFVAILEIITGISLITNKFGALFAIILPYILINKLLVHIALNPKTIGIPLVLLILNFVVLFSYKSKYKALLKI